ncbi:sulfatase family protein [Cyclobacterium marinum]|uniref:sulfatase family protein n=1 Tax=Cyclobacterium marinum TaxID=104 RepID=UPI0011ECBB36|nr:sulfatase [Cyclobacterium marinum]MBI0397156.1 sulfatase [Cyclobacterium marinum]
MKIYIPILLIIMVNACNSPQQKAENNTENNFERFRNVVFIIGDDHSTKVLGAYGNKIVKTPNLDEMAKNGVLFSHAYVNSPVCSPSRQSMITGKYPHASGVSLLSTPFPEEQISIADYLTPLGYKTAIIGKNHFNSSSNHGFENKIQKKDYLDFIKTNPPRKPADEIKSRPKWKPFKDPANIWLNADALPSTYYDEEDVGTFYAKKAIEFIQSNQNDRFCLWLGFEEPHSPFNFPIEYANKYNPENMPLPSGSQEDDRWIPEVFKDLTDEEKKGIISSYYTSVEYLDKNVGLVLNALEKAGLKESTLVIYVGDHGYLLNDHKRFEKHMMWEEAVKAPLIIQGGKAFGEGKIQSELTEFVDLFPTIIEALGEKPLNNIHGISLVPLLTEKTDKHRDSVFSEFLPDNKAMIRTNKWKYIFSTGKNDLGMGYATGFGPAGITHHLYNVEEDPKETTNLSNNPEYQEIMQELQVKLLGIFEKTHPLAGNVPASWSIEQKFIAYCEPPEESKSVETSK